jgi:hypothetical protein
MDEAGSREPFCRGEETITKNGGRNSEMIVSQRPNAMAFFIERDPASFTHHQDLTEP